MSDRRHKPTRIKTGFGKARLLSLLVAAFTLWMLASPVTAQAVTAPLNGATGNTSSAVQSATRQFLTEGFPGLPQGTPMSDSIGGGVCTKNPDQLVGASTSSLLPVNRWGGVSNRHTRQSTFSQIGNFGTSTMTMNAYSAGNSFWQASASITSWASALCFSDTMGREADKWVAGIGNAITSSMLLMILVVIGLVGVAAGRRSIKGALRVILAAGILLIMVTGATQTASKPVGQYGTGSPGWITDIVNQAVTLIGNGPAAAMNTFVIEANAASATADLSNQYNCDAYTANLSSEYDHASGTSNFSSIIPSSINSMWEQTGLKTYIAIQFGDNNKYGAKVYCRMLELQAGSPIQDSTPLANDGVLAQTTAAAKVHGTGTIKGATLQAAGYPFAVGADNDHTDRAMIAWAACKVATDGTISVDSDWQTVFKANGKGSDATSDCASFFSNTDGWQDGSSAFNFDDSTDTIAKATVGEPAVADFLYSLHGDRTSGSAATAAILYAIASFCTMLVFGIFSIAVVIAKIGMIGITFMLLFAAMQWIVVDNGDSGPVVKALTQYLSLTILAIGANLILAIITVLSKGITDFSSTGQGVVTSILAAGFAPVAATLMVHLFFTKGLKAPSPFKMTAALDYAKRAGNGSLMGDVADSTGQKFNRGKQMASSAGGRLMKGAVTRGKAAFGATSARSGAMGPLSAALGGAVGGAVIEKMHDHHEDVEEAEQKDADQKDIAATRTGAATGPGKRSMFGSHADRLDDPKHKLTGKEAATWARTGYLPSDTDAEKHAAARKMLKLSVSDRTKAAQGYFAKNRDRLRAGGIKTGAAVAGGGALFAAGAVLSAPVVMPAVVALGAYAAVKTARTAYTANHEISRIRKESTAALQQDALKAYSSGPRRAAVDHPASASAPVHAGVAGPAKSTVKRDVIVALPEAGNVFRLTPAEETLMLPEVSAHTVTMPAVVPVGAPGRTN